MQRVVRSTLVGLLTIAGITACGDKVTVPQQTTTPPGTVVHSVTVTPASLTLAVGSTAILAASVDADAGVTVRTVTWSSSNTAVATVGTDGTVTAKAAGTVTITATSAADANVKGAAAVTVGGGTSGATNPVVTISSINKTVCGVGGCASVPAPLTGVGGQIDVILNVDAGGQTLKSVGVAIKSGTDTMSTQETLSSNVASVDAAGAAAPITLSLNTALFNQTTGVPQLHNNVAASITATATTNAATPQTAAVTQTFVLFNADGAVIMSHLSGATASDANGLPWKAGNDTVTVLPVLYSGRTLSTVSVTLAPLADETGTPVNINTQTGITAVQNGPTVAVWSGTSTSGSVPHITQSQINGPADPNGFIQPFTPAAVGLDNTGTDVNLPSIVWPTGTPAPTPNLASDVRVDNLSPAAPTAFTIPQLLSPNATGQNGWVNAAYTFTGSAARYNSGGDGTGVSAGANSAGLPSGDAVTYWYAPAASFTPLTGGTQVGAANCANAGLTQISNAGALPISSTNTQYKVRVNETDKLGNVRCTDLGQPGGTTTFGTDFAPPLDSFSVASAPDKYIANIANAGAITSFQVQYGDTGTAASSFTTTPALTTVTRLYPGVTGSAACVVGNFAGGVCGTLSSAGTLPVNGTGNAANNVPGPTDNEGYYTYTSTIRDQAQNPGTTLTRQALVDITAPIMGGVQVPAAITTGPGVQTAQFATSATDNLDLVSSNYTLTYGTNVANAPGATLSLRTPGPALGTAFDNVLTTVASFSINVQNFMRNIQVTNGAGAPQGLLLPANQPNAITVRAYDAAGNAGTSGAVAIGAANVVETAITGGTPAAQNYASNAAFTTWLVSNAATNVCNVAAANCAAPANPSTVSLTAVATGTAALQNPFTTVYFYYLDPATNEWNLISSTNGQATTAVGGTTTITWTATFDPPASLGTGVNVNVIAIGVNQNGDALATPANGNITLTP